MKNEAFILVQNLKNKILLWRSLTFISIFLVFVVVLGSFRIRSFRNYQKNFLKKDRELIARVSIDGTIVNGLFSEEEMEKLKKPEVKAVILHIDSPGGDIAESEKLYSFFYELSKTKPVISVIGGSGVSGSYMVAMAGNYLVARNSSVVGSIGIIYQSYEFTSLADKIGITFNNYKSSPLKASPNPFEKTTTDVDLVVNQLIDDMYQYFLNLFIERRNIKAMEAQEIANGQLYSGRQALELGLIDGLGGEEVALKYLKNKGIDVGKTKILNYGIFYKKKYNLIDVLSEKFYGYYNSNGNSGPKSRILAIHGN
ncbi:MAG: signal peptide peptidase SppA [Rickettsiales bacterium]|jgi:protease-4|nr:signal peptide peptidase SppA [Rickettsiales bacterium]